MVHYNVVSSVILNMYNIVSDLKNFAHYQGMTSSSLGYVISAGTNQLAILPTRGIITSHSVKCL